MTATVETLDGLTRSEVARELNRSAVWVDSLAKDRRIAYTQTPLGKIFPYVEVERLKREMERKDRERGVS